MNKNIKLEKFISLFFLIYSSLGFSIGIILTKLFSNSHSLTYILKLQSIVVFTSFILQLGLRAALRVQIYNNRKRITKLTYDSIYVFLTIFSLFSFLIELYFNQYLYISLSSLLAIVTLNLTLSVAKKELKTIIIYSTLTFFVAFGSSLILLVARNINLTNILVECASFLVLISMYSVKSWSNIYKYRKVIFLIYWNAQSYQLGSCVVALFVFFLTQSAVIQFKDETLNAYSVGLIFSGFLVLILGQIMLLFERKLYGSFDNKYFLFVLLIILQFLSSAIFSFITFYIYDTDWILMMIVIFILLSRTTAGFIVQYVQVNRGNLNFISAIFFIGYSIFYFFGFKNINIIYQIYPVVIYLFLGFILLKGKINFNFWDLLNLKR